MATLLEGLSGEFAKSAWLKIASPAFVFWGVGMLAVSGIIRHPDPLRRAQDLLNASDSSPSTLALLAIATIAFLAIVGSAWLVERFTLPTIRLLEGYWPAAFFLTKWCVDAATSKRKSYLDKLQKIESDPKDDFEWAQRRTKVTEFLRRSPPFPFPMMPTRLGNILAAAEVRPIGKYGMDVVTCWARLWLLLPKENKEDLGVARAALDDAARLWLWSALLIVWAYWEPRIVVFAVAGCWLSYLVAIAAAYDYADLIEAVFDTKRMLLYDAVGMRRPASPSEEYTTIGHESRGTELTRYLSEGSDSTTSFQRTQSMGQAKQ